MVVCLIHFQEKQERLNASLTVAFLRGQQGDMLPVCDNPNAFFCDSRIGGAVSFLGPRNICDVLMEANPKGSKRPQFSRLSLIQ